jgi:hypothetical protein
MLIQCLVLVINISWQKLETKVVAPVEAPEVMFKN